MKTINKYCSGSLWLTALLLTAFVSGCGSSSSTPTVSTALAVSSTTPINLASNVALNRSIHAVFNKVMDPATINASSFTLTSGAGAVSGTVSYDNKLASFKPNTNLPASTLYTATLTTAVSDLEGNPLPAKFEWTFNTGTSAALGPAPVILRSAGNFVILTKSGITNVPTSDIDGNIGASPITAAAMDNVFCTEITGTIYGADALYTGSGDKSCFLGAAPDNTLVAGAVLDMGTAYNDAAGRTTPDFTELHAGDISGQTLVPGLYKWSTNVLINTNATLSGGANDVWIFQVSGNVIQAANSSLLLIGGALAKNVFWQVAGGTGVALDTNALFQGVVLAVAGITVNTGTTVNGRLLAQTAVTLDMNTVNQPAP